MFACLRFDENRQCACNQIYLSYHIVTVPYLSLHHLCMTKYIHWRFQFPKNILSSLMAEYCLFLNVFSELIQSLHQYISSEYHWPENNTWKQQTLEWRFWYRCVETKNLFDFGFYYRKTKFRFRTLNKKFYFPRKTFCLLQHTA